jgi:hypothetical protein
MNVSALSTAAFRVMLSLSGVGLTVLLLPAAGGGAAEGRQAISHSLSGRLTVVLGDLHLGLGTDPKTGEWHPLEDFRWSDDFSAFLNAVNSGGDGATDLILNGDTVELWQALDDECQYEESGLGCTEEQALARLNRILTAHPDEISALSRFANFGANRIVVVPGDRDAGLLFPSVARRIAGALGGPERVRVASRGSWISPDGAIYVEHGHQRRYDAFRFGSWPEPFVRHDNATHLERTWGEQLVQGFYNKYEPKYPILDNIAEDGLGLKFVVAEDPSTLSIEGTGSLVRLLLAKRTWAQFRLGLDGGDVEPPEWDLSAIREVGAAFLVESLVPGDPFRMLAKRAFDEGRLALNADELTDLEVVAICDYRAALRRSRRRLERKLSQLSREGPAVSECPRLPDTRGTAFEYFWRSRDALYQERLELARLGLQMEGRLQGPSKVFVYGHTHLTDSGFVPTRRSEEPLVVSPGAWHRTITPTHLQPIRDDQGWTEVDALRQLQPEQLPACYGVVWIEPYAENPKAEVRFWRGDGQWGRAPRDAADVRDPCPPSR